MSSAPAPFSIGRLGTEILDDPEAWRKRFSDVPAFAFDGAIAPDLAQRLVTEAAGATYADDDVRKVGTRQVESPQRVSRSITLMLGRRNWFDWIESATGCGPIKALVGRIAQTRANARDELAWHDDSDGLHRLLGIVVNLSDQDYEGGRFDLRRKGSQDNLFSFAHDRPGTMTLFKVGSDLEHRVTPLLSGGPRRVFAGWLTAEPEPGIRSLFG